MSFAEIETLWTAAQVAFDAGDYDTAYKKAVLLRGRVGTTFEVYRSASGATSGYKLPDPQFLEGFLRDCKELRKTVTTGGSIQTTKITPTRASMT